jgi:hypothetical protein
MKPLPLILSFLPLIAFSLLTRLLPSGDVGVALFTVPVVIIIYMLKFTKSYPERVSHTEASAPATS